MAEFVGEYFPVGAADRGPEVDGLLWLEKEA